MLVNIFILKMLYAGFVSPFAKLKKAGQQQQQAAATNFHPMHQRYIQIGWHSKRGPCVVLSNFVSPSGTENGWPAVELWGFPTLDDEVFGYST
mmetsp:Transcript_5148/g.7664  ORF Transcript_5148/g.7664 Transcript_5148/m.7664 type:complete len:93 (+) Transcript_5148:329-607(+)